MKINLFIKSVPVDIFHQEMIDRGNIEGNCSMGLFAV